MALTYLTSKKGLLYKFPAPLAFDDRRNMCIQKLLLSLIFQDEPNFLENAKVLGVNSSLYSKIGEFLKRSGFNSNFDSLIQALTRHIDSILDQKSPGFNIIS